MTVVNRLLPDERATLGLASRLVDALPDDSRGWLLLLEGELGAGKSTFARGVLRALGHRGPVPSPTYTLVEPYDLPGGAVYHVDLYRIADPGELRFLGFDELDRGLRLIEWPERVPELAALADIRIALGYEPPGRRAAIKSVSPRGEPVVASMAGWQPT